MPPSPQPPLLLGALGARTVGRAAGASACLTCTHWLFRSHRDRGSRGWPSLRSREPCETLTHASLFPDVLREARGQLAITESPSLFPSRGNRAQKAEGSCQRLRRSEGWCQDPCLTDVRFEVSSFKPKMEIERDRVFLD